MAARTHLVGDIGGTNARFAAAKGDGEAVILSNEWRTPVAAFPTVEDAIAAYLAAHPMAPVHACLAVAGPVHHNRAELTNADWLIDGGRIAARFGFARASIVNDFIGQALGAAATGKAQRRSIITGAGDPEAPCAVLGPGTGLGLAFLHRRPNGGWRAQATEGGHAAFAPADRREGEILAQLRATHGYVSFEMLVSGPGLQHIFAAVCALAGVAAEALTPADIVRLSASEPRCVETVAIFFSALGAFAGDAVLIGGARGGVVLAGGILPRIADALATSRFIERFRERGVMSPYLADVPIDLVIAEDVALLGAASICADQD